MGSQTQYAEYRRIDPPVLSLSAPATRTRAHTNTHTKYDKIITCVVLVYLSVQIETDLHYKSKLFATKISTNIGRLRLKYTIRN